MRNGTKKMKKTVMKNKRSKRDRVKIDVLNMSPYIYWDNKMKLSWLQRFIIIHSIIYYILDDNVISDVEYDDVSKHYLFIVESSSEEEKVESEYWYCMNDFDANTGYDLYYKLKKKDKNKLTKYARHILSMSKKG